METDRKPKSNYDLWKYCTAEQAQEMLRSFRLLENTSVREEKYFACLYAVSNHTEQHYHEAYIPKKSGGKRKLFVPDPLLKTIQRNIVKHVLAELPVSSHATAYCRRTSVVDNAMPHVGREQVMKLDMKDFFQNITFSMVYQYAFPAVYYPASVRTMLACLCCRRDCLPQGAPSSPAVSNLVMRPFDEYMGKWCEERKIHYTRYCDDMTFSGTFDKKEVKQKVKGFLHVLGFELNEKKTQVQRQGNRQTVTGIVVNEKAQVNREYRRKLRAELYYCRKYGVEAHMQRMRGTTGAAEIQKKEQSGENTDAVKYMQQLAGRINYVLQVNPEDAYFRKMKEELKMLYGSLMQTYLQ